jgi:rare lipoprotein A
MNSNSRKIAGLVLFSCFLSVDAFAQNQFSGIAAYYSADYAGRTACGERYDPKKFTAAHRTLPFGTKVLVTNRQTGRSVVVRINDRGPFVPGRIIDLTPAAAQALGFSGLAHVTVDVIGRS